MSPPAGSSTANMIVTIGMLILILLQQQQQHQVGATESVRVVFNNGEEATSDTFCSDEDNYIISQAMEYISSNNINHVRYRRRRHLRQSNDDITATTDFQMFLENKATKRDTDTTTINSSAKSRTTTSSSRMARTYTAKCRDLCSGYRTGTCRATNCVGYRRRTAMVSDGAITGSQSDEQARHLQPSWECHHLMEYTNFVFNEMITEQYVSSTCSTFLMEDRRTVDCFDNTMFGEIVQVYITYSSSNSSSSDEPDERIITTELPIDGESQLNICKNVIDDDDAPTIRLEAIGNECVYNVDLTIVFTDNEVYHEYHTTERPYEAYVPDIQQQTGHYHVIVTPNGNDVMSKVYSFDIVDC